MKSRKVAQYDLDGNFMSIHDSINSAARSVNLKSHSGILACCKLNPNSNSTAGFQWRYVDEYFDPLLNIGHSVKRGEVFKELYGTNTEGSLKLNKKRKETLINRYNVDHPMKSEEIRERYKSSCIEKYGDDNPAKNENVKKKISLTERNNKTLRFIKNLIPNTNVINVTDDNIFTIIDSGCKHTFQINRQLLTIRSRNSHKLCTICNPVDSNQKSEIENYLTNILKSNNIFIENNVKDLVESRHEVDIYLTDYKIGIEINGIKFHSEEYGKFSDYHLNKTRIFNDAGIFLYHFFDDEVEKKSPIIESMLLNKINKTERKIFARKCDLVKISNKTAIDFFNSNHIQGAVNSEFSYGLYYHNELVSVMSFGPTRKFISDDNGNEAYELLRFANLIKTTVVGGASKLLKRFISDVSPKRIITYANRRWSSGNLYEKLGFNFIGFTKPGYYFFYKNKRLNRISLRRSELIKMGQDPSKTTEDMLIDIGAYRIWDCGNYKYSLDLSR